MSVDLTGFEPVDVKMPSDSLKKDAIKCKDRREVEEEST